MGTFKMNVLAFSSPISGSISGAQTRKYMRWYPIKANQPEIQFDVQFIGEQDYERFQDAVHESQKLSLSSRQPMVRLNWPERNINNWSGLITQFQGGGMRFNPAPRAKFTVFLFDSYVSSYNEMTQLASLGANFAAYFPIMSVGFTRILSNAAGLTLPSARNSNKDKSNNGNTTPTTKPQTLLPTIEAQQ